MYPISVFRISVSHVSLLHLSVSHIYLLHIFAAPKGKRDGVIRYILERENGNWRKKLRYYVNVERD